MKKLISLVLAMVMLTSLLAACSPKKGSNSQGDSSSTAGSNEAGTKGKDSSANKEEKPEEVTIKVSYWDATFTERMGTIISEFEAAYPHIKIDLIDIPSGDYNTKLSVMLNGGSELDAFFIKDASDTPAMATKGQLVDLTEYVQKDSIDLGMFNGVADNLKFDGTLAAMPFNSSYYILYYNKDLFDAAGIDYPSNNMTWAEFEDLATKLTSGTGADKKYGALFHTWQACIQNWAVADGKVTILDEDLTAFKPYYEMVLRMQDAGTIMDYATLKTSNLHYSNVFMQGNVAMMPMGGWFIATLLAKTAEGETDVNWGIATLPHGEGVEAGYTVGSITPVAINQHSSKKDAAWEFVKFVTTQKGAEINASFGEFPAYLTEQTLADIANKEGMPEGALEALQVKNINLDRPLNLRSAGVNQILDEQHTLIMLGELTIDEGIAKMQELSKTIE